MTELAANSTRLFIDLFGASESAPQGMFAASGKLFFTVLLADRRQRELYATDGTIAGTVVVKNLAGSESADPSNFYAVGQKLWFTAATNANERELYTSDGSSLGTVLLKNFAGSGNPTRGRQPTNDSNSA